MKNLEPCVINGGKTTPYFELERGNRKAIFFLIKANPNIEGLQFFSDTFLYSAYADYTTLFLRKRNQQLK